MAGAKNICLTAPFKTMCPGNACKPNLGCTSCSNRATPLLLPNADLWQWTCASCAALHCPTGACTATGCTKCGRGSRAGCLARPTTLHIHTAPDQRACRRARHSQSELQNRCPPCPPQALLAGSWRAPPPHVPVRSAWRTARPHGATPPAAPAKPPSARAVRGAPSASARSGGWQGVGQRRLQRRGSGPL